jgi:hypothetical protein
MERFAALAFFLIASIGIAAEVPSALPPSGPLPEVDDSGIGFESPQAALDALRRKPGTQIRQEAGWTIVQDQESDKVLALWTFTPDDHPAHPAAVKRIIVERDGAIYLEMKVQCRGSKANCDALVRDFQALNDKARASMQQRNP